MSEATPTLHSKLPWRVDDDDTAIISADLCEVAICEDWVEGATGEDNASLIVTAVNQHTALMQCASALREARKDLILQGFTPKGLRYIDEALAALEKSNV